ncbi:hypothetical protein [Demequina flava]|uniref:hypothetical protein n=1 Tax=Demequina flava TaxID=1095025 RepID=UPI0007857523|nr:hypothetical protein [Demequina flava]
MTVSGVPSPGIGEWTRRRGRENRATPGQVQSAPSGPFPLEIDAAHEPHAEHPAREHASNVNARRAGMGVVAIEWAVKFAVFAGLIAVIYFAWTDNWFGAATDAVGSWYGEEVAPWMAIDFDSAVEPVDGVPADSVLVRTGP